MYGSPVFVNVFANDFLFSESPKNANQLFSGKRVSASVRSSDNTEMPSDFGEGAFLEKHGMIDGCFSSRLEVKNKIVTLTMPHYGIKIVNFKRENGF